MSSWDPQQYLKFAAPRLRPALDLLSQIPLEKPGVVYDLGCGAGNVTQYLQKRWPKSVITGVDNSPEMLKSAAKACPDLQFQLADVGTWKPQEKADLIYSNATLHWLPDHPTLFPKLMGFLKPGGVLAVQMPGNFNAPSHQLVKEVALSGPWKDQLEPMLKKDPPVLEPSDYYRILGPYCDKLNIWESQYLQVMDGENPVAEFTKGSWLKPFLDALSEPMCSQFEAEYRKRILKAYPQGPDGKTLFPFRRLFIVATAKQN